MADEVPQQLSSSKRPKAVGLGKILISAADVENELIKHRFLCRGGSLLLVGPTGIGKSTFTMQMMVNFALGRPMFGLTPSGALKILIVQSENDEGDLVEMREGALRGMQISPEETEKVHENICVWTEDERAGKAFTLEVLTPLLEDNRPDIVVIDPVLAYLGGDMLKQDIVGHFTRTLLNPLIKKHKCGLIIVHHTNKAPGPASVGDVYSAAGSAEWVNWARAVMVLAPKRGHIFKLTLAKRGARAGWKTTEGVTMLEKHIGQSKEVNNLCWSEVDNREMLGGASPKGVERKALILKLIPEVGTVSQDEVYELAKSCGIGENACKATVKELHETGTISKIKVPRSGTRHAIFLSRDQGVASQD